MLATKKNGPKSRRVLWLLPTFVSCVWLTMLDVSALGVTDKGPENAPHRNRATPVGPITVHEIEHDTSPPLRSLHPHAGNRPTDSQLRLGYNQSRIRIPTPVITFEGLSNLDNVVPPNPGADVGLNHYFQSAGSYFQIWDKGGSSVYGPVRNSIIWQDFGGPCDVAGGGGSLAVLYDPMAHRWFVSASAFPNFPNGPFQQCLAVSQTDDPTGQWHRYAFTTSQTKFPGLPRFGVWPDGYYMTANLFEGVQFDWAGTGQYVFDRARMLAGQSATMQYFEQPITDWGGMLPTDFDGLTQPPDGSPNYFVEVNDDAWNPPHTQADELLFWRFHVDWSNPSNTTFTGPAHLPVAPFDGIVCCVPQPNVNDTIDPMNEMLMPRLAYRNMGDHESLVLNHTVQPDSSRNGYTGVRWYELRNPQTVVTIFQQGTYAPDFTSRWLGSISMDRDGNIAAGFSATSSSVYPSIRYAGRLVSDPPGTFAQGEAILQAGTGSVIGPGRWSNASSLSVDPADDCTFWYTNEYYPVTGSTAWHTSIGAFKFPSCGANTPTVTPSAMPTTPPTATTTTTTTTATPTGTCTPEPTHTQPTLPTYTNTPTLTFTPTVTSLSTGTRTPMPTCSAVPTFTDVGPDDWYYDYVLCLACRGIITGYVDGTFRPYANATRGQMSKIVVLAVELNINCPATPHFTDVPPDSPFYCFIETAYEHEIITGYQDGTFRPGNNVTRGQLCKMMASAMEWILIHPETPAFSDVPSGSPFYEYIETAVCHQIISGYADGTFQPGNNATRAQIAKIVCLAARNEYDCVLSPTTTLANLNH